MSIFEGYGACNVHEEYIMYILRALHTLGVFFSPFLGDNFYDFLFCFQPIFKKEKFPVLFSAHLKSDLL